MKRPSRQARCGDRIEVDGTEYVCDRIDAHKGTHAADRWADAPNGQTVWTQLAWATPFDAWLEEGKSA